MRVFVWLTSFLVGYAMARPEAGYSYNGLQHMFGLQQNELLAHQQLPAEHNFASFISAPQTTYGVPTLTSNNIEQQPSAPEGLQFQPQPAQDSYNNAYEHSTNSLHDGGYPYAPQPTSIHKHIYVHVPPKDFEDSDVIETRVRHQAAPKQKHYKIVFIKAPAAPSILPPVVPPPPQNEEKTLIYVLHKKPEATADIVIPTAVPTKPTKPEVYFIKYKTKKEQAPVYGPPPQPQSAVDNSPADIMEPRHAEPSNEYGAPTTADFVADLGAPITTIQPTLEEQQPQQFVSDLSAPESYEAPTMTTFMAEQQQLTGEAPSSQYLPPASAPESSMTPIVVEEPAHLPASSYGPPSNRFFLKKKK